MKKKAENVSNRSTSVRQIKTTPSSCVVCGDRARYSYFGAIVCLSCKVFFRRHARTQQNPLTCRYDDHCDINITNRHICASCRLAKCFANGMNADRIRSSLTKHSNTTSREVSTSLALRNQFQQIPTLNLLQSDNSTLNADQWNQLSNLSHCFDEYNGVSIMEHFINEQNALPAKIRYKHPVVNSFLTEVMSKIQLLVEKNRNFLRLSFHDRTILLTKTVKYTTCFGLAFLFRQGQLLDDPSFAQSIELIFQPAALDLLKRLINQLDLDVNFIKILFVIISFLMSDYTIYNQTPPSYLNDAKAIIRIQDIYTDLAWRYLIYKHHERDAVLCFSNFIRCLCLLNNSVVQSTEVPGFTDIIDSVIQSTEVKLRLNS